MWAARTRSCAQVTVPLYDQEELGGGAAERDCGQSQVVRVGGHNSRS